MSNLYPAVTRGRPPAYLYTNECLDAIVKGLDVNETDDIIAVCSSGDQAFTLLEYANSVLAVDNEEDSVKYAQYRLEALKAGYIGEFLKPRRFCDLNCSVGTDVQKSNVYFMRGKRMEKIRQKLDRLEIRHVKDFIDEVSKNKFSKAYLSNILGYSPSSANPKSRIAYLEKTAAGLREPGLVYISNCNSYLTDSISAVNAITNVKELTATARATENHGGASMLWLPAVFRRRA